MSFHSTDILVTTLATLLKTSVRFVMSTMSLVTVNGDVMIVMLVSSATMLTVTCYI